MARHLYAVAIKAFKLEHITLTHRVGVLACTAVSDEEALGKGLVAARETWPADKDWEGHDATIVEVPEGLIRQVMDNG